MDDPNGSDRSERAAELRLDLAGQPASVPGARGAVTGLGSMVDDPCARTVGLLVSELVSNAILHGGATRATSLSVGMTISEDRVRVEVCDPGQGLAAPGTPPGLDREGGWGLVLVDRMASRWGTYRGEAHCVWFEVDRGHGTPCAGPGQPAGSTDTATPA